MITKSKLPGITIVVPTYNEEDKIEQCLTSIFKQDYPMDKLEIFVVDDTSEDKTVEIAKRFPVKIFLHKARHGEYGKMIGFKKSTKDFFIYLDADVVLTSKYLLRKLIYPLINDENIVASFTDEGASRKDPPLLRYLSFDFLQRDQLYQLFSPTLETVIEKRFKRYIVCKYKEGSVLPAGRCLFRKKALNTIVDSFNMFLELDFLVLLTRNGFDRFAYVPNAGLVHKHVASIIEMAKKRIRNVKRVYLLHVSNKLFVWVDLSEGSNIVKLLLWILYANAIIPSIFTGLYKSIRHKDYAGLYEPVVNMVNTDVIIWSFLTSRRGRDLFFSAAKAFLKVRL